MLDFLKDRVNKKVQNWDGRLISQAAKEVLIKLVAETLPSYATSVYLLSLDIIRDVERSLSKYWLKSGTRNNRRIHWMSWERMSRHKSSRGLGFRDPRDFNMAMLEKQSCRFLTKSNSLVSRLYKARYFSKGNFLGGNN